MEVIPHLVPGPAKADVLQGSSSAVGMDPEREDALIGLAELAGSGQHAASIDENGKAKSNPVFQGEDLGCEL